TEMAGEAQHRLRSARASGLVELADVFMDEPLVGVARGCAGVIPEREPFAQLVDPVSRRERRQQRRELAGVQRLAMGALEPELVAAGERVHDGGLTAEHVPV